MTKCPFTRYGLITTALVLSAAFPIHAQPAESGAGETDELPRIVISDPNRDLFRLALPNATGEKNLARSATEIEQRDLSITGLFRVLDPVSFPDTLQKEGMGFSSALWSEVGAQGVAKMNVTQQGSGLALEGRLYQVGRGESAVMSKTYRGGARWYTPGPTTSLPSSPASAACSGPASPLP
jgi:hypothetical protein